MEKRKKKHLKDMLLEKFLFSLLHLEILGYVVCFPLSGLTKRCQRIRHVLQAHPTHLPALSDITPKRSAHPEPGKTPQPSAGQPLLVIALAAAQAGPPHGQDLREAD